MATKPKDTAPTDKHLVNQVDMSNPLHTVEEDRLPFIRSAYNYDMHAASEASGLECKDKSLAHQEFKEESDINFIADRYGLTGEIPQVLNLPAYGDFTGIFDFQTAQNAVRQAVEQFGTLPAKLRARFQNSPQKLIEFLDDPDNRKEAEFLGLVEPRNAREEPLNEPKGAPETKGEGEALSPPKPKAKGAPTNPKTDT